jgi:hypothetical protein
MLPYLTNVPAQASPVKPSIGALDRGAEPQAPQNDSGSACLLGHRMG